MLGFMVFWLALSYITESWWVFSILGILFWCVIGLDNTVEGHKDRVALYEIKERK